MLLLPIPIGNNRIRLLIVLEDDNLERIKRHDCAEVIWKQLGPYAHYDPDVIGIGYVNPEESKRLHELAAKGKIMECLKLVTGGFEYRPDLGDHDLGPVSINVKPQRN